MLTPRQQGLYRDLVNHAWAKHCARNPSIDPADKIAKDKWRRRVMVEGMGVYSTKEIEPRGQFAKLMSLFEQIIGNRPYWTIRAETSEEIRQIRWWIDQALVRIGGDWRYAQGIIDQMNFPGQDLDDLSIGQLHKVFQALDTHLRRHQVGRDWKDVVREQSDRAPATPHRRAA